MPVEQRHPPPEVPRPAAAPPRVLLISVLALGVAATGAFVWPDSLSDYSALVWLLALIPCFLLAYHKGWRGAATAMAAAMLLLVGVEVGLAAVFGGVEQVDWRVFATVSIVLITVSLGVGAVSELHLRDKTSASLLAYTDALTGIPNRRVLNEFTARYFAAAERGRALAVVMFDVDGFKRYNDRYGHASGDDALRAISRILENNTRGMDLTGRYGGEEFVTLMPGSLASDARVFAERVRAEVEGCRDLHGRGLTISAGIAEYDPTMGTSKELLEAADAALYAAKETGKNAVVVATRGEFAEAPVPATPDR